jgi:YD repeat-containing protein
VIYSTPRGKTRIDVQDLQGLDLVTTNTYDELDRLTSTTLPEAGSIGYIYDGNSNILTVTHTPKPSSPLLPLTTTYAYDPLWNKPTSVTDPLGLVTTLSWDQLQRLGPALLTLLLIVWTFLVSPYSQYGDKWAIYPPMALLLLAVLWHIYQVIFFEPRWKYVIYATIHLPVMAIILIYCMMIISKDSI